MNGIRSRACWSIDGDTRVSAACGSVCSSRMLLGLRVRLSGPPLSRDGGLRGRRLSPARGASSIQLNCRALNQPRRACAGYPASAKRPIRVARMTRPRHPGPGRRTRPARRTGAGRRPERAWHFAVAPRHTRGPLISLTRTSVRIRHAVVACDTARVQGSSRAGLDARSGSPGSVTTRSGRRCFGGCLLTSLLPTEHRAQPPERRGQRSSALLLRSSTR